MLEDSCARICEWVQLRGGKDTNSVPEDTDEPAVAKHVTKPERTHIVITSKRVLELMTHGDLQEASGATQKLLMSRWTFTAFGVVDKHRHFHPTGCSFANKVDTDSCAHLMIGLSERVEKLFHMPPDVKNSLNDDNDAMFKGLKLVLPLASLGDCCTRIVATSAPKMEHVCH